MCALLGLGLAVLWPLWDKVVIDGGLLLLHAGCGYLVALGPISARQFLVTWGPGVTSWACARIASFCRGRLPVASGPLGLLSFGCGGSIWDLRLPSAGVCVQLSLGSVVSGLYCSWGDGGW